MLEKNKGYLYLFIAITILTAFIFYYQIVDDDKEQLQYTKYQEYSSLIKKQLAELIDQKQKSTVAIALSLVNNSSLIKDIQTHNISQDHYTHLIEEFKKNTNYKNIWIHIIDDKLNSIYRSWDSKEGENLLMTRDDLIEIKNNKKVITNINSGKYTLAIRAIVPVSQGSEVVGIIEVISHFNSISKMMKKYDVDSVVVLKKEYSELLSDPFTNKFVNGNYIANFDAKENLIHLLESNGVEKYITNNYGLEDDLLFTSYELKSVDGVTLGYYIGFIDTKKIPNPSLDFFMLKSLAIAIVVLLLVLGFVSLFFTYLKDKEKQYYRRILNSSTNIMLIKDKFSIIDVNEIFFKYFEKYKSLEEFKKDYYSVCELFVEEEGYISAVMNGTSWVDYIIENNDKGCKVKIQYQDKIYYFTVGAYIVSEEKERSCIVFADITNEETYKIELERSNLTDSLTGIGNRRSFDEKMLEETKRADRYKHPLSFIIFDIDHFKKVNDTYGHGVGDEVLIEYSKFISEHIRAQDIFCRIGGEEFFIILPETPKEVAYKLAQKIRKSVEEYKKVLPITMSFGVSEYINGADIELMFKIVDDALYEAKKAGRNKVVVA